jgi:phage tail-like protein
MMTWNITNAFPIKLTGPSLNSGSSDVAVEEIVFTYEGLETSLAG